MEFASTQDAVTAATLYWQRVNKHRRAHKRATKSGPYDIDAQMTEGEEQTLLAALERVLYARSAGDPLGWLPWVVDRLRSQVNALESVRYDAMVPLLDVVHKLGLTDTSVRPIEAEELPADLDELKMSRVTEMFESSADMLDTPSCVLAGLYLLCKRWLQAPDPHAERSDAFTRIDAATRQFRKRLFQEFKFDCDFDDSSDNNLLLADVYCDGEKCESDLLMIALPVSTVLDWIKNNVE